MEPTPDTITAPTGNYAVISISLIGSAEINPRQHADGKAFEQLKASIAAVGLLHPIGVRLMPEGEDLEHEYEVVWGSRRLSACTLLGWERIPAMIFDLSDAEVEARSVIENMEREALTPLDEAFHFQRMMARDGLGLVELAAVLSRPTTYVASALALTKLAPPALKALRDGKIEIEHARVLARYPAEVQKSGVQVILDGTWTRNVNEPLSPRALAGWLSSNIRTPLDAVPWSLDDAELVPKAGACNACPKNTALSRDLFPDDKKAICTDPACANAKHAAFVKLKVADTKVELSAERAAELANADTPAAKAAVKAKPSKVVEVTTASYHSEGKTLGTGYFTVLPKAAKPCKDEAVGVVAIGKNVGERLRVCLAPGKCKVHAGATHHVERRKPTEAEKQKAARDRESHEAALAAEQGVYTAVRELVLEKGEKAIPRPALEALVLIFFSRLWHDAQKTAQRRLGFVVDKPKGQQGDFKDRMLALQKHLAKLPGTNAVYRELVTLAMVIGDSGTSFHKVPSLEALLYKGLGVDVKAAQAKGKAERLAALKAREKPSKTAAPAKGATRHK